MTPPVSPASLTASLREEPLCSSNRSRTLTPLASLSVETSTLNTELIKSRRPLLNSKEDLTELEENLTKPKRNPMISLNYRKIKLKRERRLKLLSKPRLTRELNLTLWPRRSKSITTCKSTACSRPPSPQIKSKPLNLLLVSSETSTRPNPLMLCFTSREETENPPARPMMLSNSNFKTLTPLLLTLTTSRSTRKLSLRLNSETLPCANSGLLNSASTPKPS